MRNPRHVLPLLFLCYTIPLLSQTGLVSLQNVRLEDTVFVADLYLKRTGTQQLYLTDCTFYLNIDSTKFGTPQLSFTDDLPGNYATSTFIYTTFPNLPWVISIDITFLSSRPRTTNTVQISDAGYGTKLGTLRLSGFQHFTGTFAPVWRTTYPLKTVLYSYDPQLQNVVPITYTVTQPPAIPLGPFFTIQLANQQLAGTTYSADLLIRRTGGTAFYLDTASLSLRIDTTTFGTSPQFTLEDLGTTRLENYYTINVARSNDTLILLLRAPRTTSQSEFMQKIQQIPDTALRLATLRITGLRRAISVTDLHPTWLPTASIVQRRRPASPWHRSDRITENGTWEIAPAAVSLQLLAPRTPDTICVASPDTLRWSVVNANAVQVTLVQLLPSYSIAFSDTVFAENGRFLWFPPPSTTGKAFRFHISTLGSNAQQDSSALRWIGNAPTILSHPATVEACPGDTAIFTVAFSGFPAPTVQWEVSNNGLYWGAILGEVDATLRIANVQSQQDSLYYRARITNQCGTIYSKPARLFLMQPIAIAAHPTSQTVCAGSAAMFRVSVTGTKPKFQWEYRSSPTTGWHFLPNAQDSVLLLPAVTPGQDQWQYRVRIWNECSDTLVSSPALLTVHQAPAIQLNLAGDTISGCAGNTALLQATVTGTPTPNTIWEYSTDNGTTWFPAQTGTTVLQLQLAPYLHNRLYRLQAINECGRDTSRTIRILVYTSPVITAQPLSQAACPGSIVSFAISVEGFPPPHIIWQQSQDSGNTWTAIANADTTQLTFPDVPANWDQMLIRAIARNRCGQDTSAVAVLDVYRPPDILQHPQDATICAGDTLTLSAIIASDPPATYQWQMRLPQSTHWITLPADTTPTLRIPHVTADRNQEQFRLLIFHPCDTLISDTATLTVIAPPTILQEPISVETRVAKSASFTVVADTFAQHYQWYRNGIALQDGARIYGSTAPTLTITAVHPSDVSNNYYCIVSGECGSDTTRAVSLTVIVPGIRILQHPQDQSLCKGNIATFTVVAQPTEDSTTLLYQWRRGEEPLEEGGKYQGVTTSTLTIFNVDSDDAATNYNVQITALPGGKIAYSKNAALEVALSPTITRAPRSARLCVGETVLLEVQAQGSAPLQYQWYHNNLPIADATQPRLYLENLDPADAGTYFCTVANTCGSTQSPPATLVVNEPPIWLHFPTDTTVTENDTLRLQLAVAGSPPLRYRWFKNGQPWKTLDTNLLLFAPIHRTDEGTYFCILENTCGTEQSPTFHIAVILSTIMADKEHPPVRIITGGDVVHLVLPSNPRFYPLHLHLFTLTGTLVARHVLHTPQKGYNLPTGNLSSGQYLLQLRGRQNFRYQTLLLILH